MAPELPIIYLMLIFKKGNLKLYLLPDKKNSLFIKQT